MPVSTVTVELRPLGLNRLSKLAPPVPVVRYEREGPGELVHMDFGRFARITRVGHRIHGDRSKRAYGAGWEFYHAAIDYASRVACCPVNGTRASWRFLLRVVAFFERQGVKISRLMTDNGPGYRSRLLTRTLEALGIRHIFIGPTHLRLMARSNASSGPRSRRGRTRALPTLAGPHRSLDVWLRYYNCVRRHSGIGRLTPFQRGSE